MTAGGMEVGCISRTPGPAGPTGGENPGVSQVPVGQLVLVPGVPGWNAGCVYRIMGS